VGPLLRAAPRAPPPAPGRLCLCRCCRVPHRATQPAPHHRARRLCDRRGRRSAGPAASVLGGYTEAQRAHLGGRPARRRGLRRDGAEHRRARLGDGRAPRHALPDRRHGAGVHVAARGGGRCVGPTGPGVEELLLPNSVSVVP